MSINTVIINSHDVLGSVEFYTRHLQAEVVGEASAERAVLDLVTATVELRGAPRTDSSWVSDDLQRGFRHVGFKVERVDPRAAALKAAGVRFHLDPLDAEGGVRICFFLDPDGTLLELVEGDLDYATVLDRDGVTAERALGVPDRPRLDHVAITVADRAATEAFYRPLGFTFIGTIEQPDDPRGFSIGYLRSAETVLEVFTYQVPLTDREVQLDAPGFSHVELTGSAPAAAAAVPGSTTVVTDPDGFAFRPATPVLAPGSGR